MKIKQWVIQVFCFVLFYLFFFFKLVFHNNNGAIILANLVYSPRACLWEHHVYCAVFCQRQWNATFVMVVTDGGDVILDHYPLGYPLLNEE